MQKLLLILIRAYQIILSPIVGQQCRFYPTCSCYAHTAISRYGALRGGWMMIRRLSRCHPWHEGGMDLVPEIESQQPNQQSVEKVSAVVGEDK